MKLLNAFFAISTVNSVHAYFRMECPGRTGLARLDPIVSPGGFSSHAHAVHGSSGEFSHQSRMGTLSLSRMSVLIIIPSRFLSDIPHQRPHRWQLHLVSGQTGQVCILATTPLL
jgi:hypothetical protein